MAKISWKRCSLCLFFITGLLLGFILGVLGLTVLVSYRIDKYYERICYLEAVIEDKNIKLEKLNDSFNKKKYMLRDIEVIFINDIDEVVGISLQKHIKEKYAMLIGKEIKDIDADMIEQVVHNRMMRLDDREYKLKFDKLVISEVMRLWLFVETIN